MQVNQNVNAANFLLVSNRAGMSVSTEEETNAGMDFASVLKSTNENYPYQSNSQAVKSHIAKTVTGSDGLTAVSKEGKNNQTVQGEQNTSVEKKSGNDAKTETKETAKTKEAQIDDSKKVDETLQSEQTEEAGEVGEMSIVMEATEEISEEDMSVLLETIGNLLQTVMNQFGLTAEELSVKLDELGMKPEELLTGDGLKDFFLKMNDAVVSDLIVNEDLNAELQSFMSTVSEDLNVIETIQTESGVALSEQDVQVALEQLIPQQQAEEDVPVLVTDGAKNEPDVVVVQEAQRESSYSEKNTNTTNEESDNQQSEQTVDEPVKQEVPTADSTSAKQPTFENPILQAIQNAVNNVEAAAELEQPIHQSDIIRQVVEQIRVNMNQHASSIEMQLYPEHLGRIQINVVSKEGVMTASIVAETEAAKQAIEAGLMNLKEAMEQQNLKVEAIEVMVSTMGFEQNDEQQQSFDEKGSSNPRRKLDLSELQEELPVEDEAEVEKMKASGSSVSYRA